MEFGKKMDWSHFKMAEKCIKPVVSIKSMKSMCFPFPPIRGKLE